MAGRARRGGLGAVLAALFGLGVLSALGFAVGLVLGAIWEEPGLVFGHLAGDTEEVPWASEEAAGGAASPPTPASAAQPEAAPTPPALDLPSVEPSPQRGLQGRKPRKQEALPREQKVSRRAPAEVSAAPPVTGGFAVQVGAFAQSDAAERLAQRLREKGMGVYVSPSSQEGAARWRVRVGPVASRAEAERLAARIKTDEKLPTWVLQEEGR